MRGLARDNRGGRHVAASVKGGAVDVWVPFRASRRLLRSAMGEALQRKQSAMNGKHAAILNITLDCADARAQASFWAAALGWTAREQADLPPSGTGPGRRPHLPGRPPPAPAPTSAGGRPRSRSPPFA